MTPTEIRTACAKGKGWTDITIDYLYPHKAYNDNTEVKELVGIAPSNQHLPKETSFWRVPYYDSNPSAALTLCDALAGEGWVCYVDNAVSGKWYCVFRKLIEGRDKTHICIADTFMLAICGAFLKVKGTWQESSTGGENETSKG